MEMLILISAYEFFFILFKVEEAREMGKLDLL